MITSPTRLFRLFIYSLEAFVVTFIIAFISVTFLSDYPPTSARIIVALTPLIPMIIMLVFFLRYLNQIDELQLRIQLLAIGFAAGVTGSLTFLYGFLEIVGFPPISLMWVFPIMVFLWGIGLAFVSRRYG